jgi:hypothetical protein
MNPPVLETEAKTVSLPQWERAAIIRQQEMIQILSEIIRRQLEQEACDEPQQDS